MRHQCNRNGASGEQGDWHYCPMCDGRYHEDGCTSKLNPRFDHCPARHKALHKRGFTIGLADSSFIMWAVNYPEGYHPVDTGLEFCRALGLAEKQST